LYLNSEAEKRFAASPLRKRAKLTWRPTKRETLRCGGAKRPLRGGPRRALLGGRGAAPARRAQARAKPRRERLGKMHKLWNWDEGVEFRYREDGEPGASARNEGSGEEWTHFATIAEAAEETGHRNGAELLEALEAGEGHVILYKS